ncbi:MAG: flagellar basal body rod protein FlgB [Planctomycetota bacterium]
MTNADAIPVLERLMSFAAGRHRLLVHNVANLSTPGFRPLDVSVEDFQARLGEAVDTRRQRSGAGGGELPPSSSGEVRMDDGRLTLRPTPVGDNLLFHDGNDRDVERTMQSLVENFMAFRTSAQLLRSRFDLINTAIRERI